MTVFNDFSEAYDLMFPWSQRQAREGAFYQDLFRRYAVRTVLDCACGTGMHVIKFAELGLESFGSDLSSRMVETAQESAIRVGVTVNLRVASFCELSQHFDQSQRFDAVICVGNSLTLAPDDGQVARAVREMASLLNPGGICVLHIFNWDLLAQEGLRIMPASLAVRDGSELTFLRVFHHRGNTIDLHIVVLDRSNGGVSTQVLTAHQRPVGPNQLLEYARAAGFRAWHCYAAHDGTPFSAETSDNLILVAER